MYTPLAHSIPDVAFLDWDSHFFGLKIGRVNVNSQTISSLNSVLENAREQQYVLLYVFCESGVSVSQKVLHAYNGQFVDHKVIYEQTLNGAYPAPKLPIQTNDAADDRMGLYELAYQSGKYSRYHVDPNFGEATFQRLYRQWIDNSISGILADEVFVHKTGQSITGFVTLKKMGDTGVIGLIATEVNQRGKGIGTTLLKHVKYHSENIGIARLEVATQRRNEMACRFYEKNQFCIKNASNVYHFWL